MLSQRDLRVKFKDTIVFDLLTSVVPHLMTYTIIPMVSYLGPHETLDVECWFDDLFYIVVYDDRKFDTYSSFQVSRARYGLTVNVKTEEIVWNTDKKYTTNGGNCFVRSNKWKTFVKRTWYLDENSDKIHWYKTVHPLKME